MEAALKTFFSAPCFAVAGASSDPSKFGHRVLVWYMNHKLPVTPINPSCSAITFPDSNHQAPRPSMPTVPSPAALTQPTQTSLSVITPPRATLQVLQEAKRAGVKAVWLQPGSFDDEGLAFARKEWPDAAVAGADVPGTKGGEGWCLLVDGDWGMELAGRSREKL